MQSKGDIDSIIKELINSQVEGDYWDFKEMHHENKGDLLHDIICMANNLADRDAYIIYGVRDKTCEIIGVERNENRPNQQKIIDFLKDKDFAGGVRPSVSMTTLPIDKHEIDVLIIHNTYDTPYYLNKKYQGVFANQVYTRIRDTNTPKNENADIKWIEYLWKKRFRLDKPAIVRFEQLLKDKANWSYTYEEDELGDLKVYHNVYHPEFTISIANDEERRHLEFYSYHIGDTVESYKNITLKYYGTTLKKFLGIVLDSRVLIVTPQPEFVRFNEGSINFDLAFKYYTRNSIEYDLCNFFFDEDSKEEYEYIIGKLNEIILTFNDEDEKSRFVSYLKNNEDKIKWLVENEPKPCICIYDNNQKLIDHVEFQIKIGLVLVKLYCSEFSK